MSISTLRVISVWIFEEIRGANGDWKAVEEQLKGLLSAVEE